MLSPYTAVTVDSNDEPIKGTMINNGTKNYSLPINGVYTIPQGYHSGEGKVTQSVTTMKGSNITPNTSPITINTDQKYINGNFTIPAFTLPSPNTIKKGVVYTLYGKSVVGTFEGWVPTPTDLYYNGTFNMGAYTLDTGIWRAENTRLFKIFNNNNYNNENFLYNLNINITSYSRIIFEGNFVTKITNSGSTALLVVLTDIGFCYGSSYSGTTQLVVDITQAKNIRSILCYLGINSYVTRIRLA